MIRVLFVDPEQPVLDGLRRSLRGQRAEWQMDFVADPARALLELPATPADVVVSDLRLPAADGAEFLQHVQDLRPESIRIALTGHADNALLIRNMSFVHQYLPRPCDPGALVDSIRRTLQVRELLKKPTLQALANQVGELPPVPQLYEKITRALRRNDATVHEVGALVAQDPVVSGKLLRMVNSAYFGLPRQVGNAEQAAVLLGLDTVRQLVLAIETFSHFPTDPASRKAMDDIWRRSLLAGKLARRMAVLAEADPATVDCAATAGLLHGIGRLALLSAHPDRAEQIVRAAKLSEFGAYLLGLWGLPVPLLEAVAYHESPRQVPHQGFLALSAVHLAMAMLDCLESAASPHPCRLDQAYVEELGVATAFQQLREEAPDIIGAELAFA